MLQNVGAVDRIARVLIGLSLVAAAAFGLIGGWGWLGLLPLITGAVGTCPAYLSLGLSSFARRHRRP